MTTAGRTLGNLVLKITADTKQVDKDFDATKKKGLDIGKALKGAAIGAGVFAGAAAGATLLGEKFAEADRIIQAGTGAQGEALKTLEEDFRAVYTRVPGDANAAATAIADLNTHLGLSGQTLQDTAAIALEQGRIMGVDTAAYIDGLSKSMAIFNVEPERAAFLMDKLLVVSQNTGIGLDKLSKQMQTYGPVFQNAGFSIDETAAFLGNLNKAGLDASRVMPGLNAFMRNAANEGVTDLKGALNATILEIQNAGSSTEALSLATAAFGAEGAQRMSVAIRNGALDLTTLQAAMGEASGATERLAADTNTAGDQFDLIKQKVSLFLEPLGDLGQQYGPMATAIATTAAATLTMATNLNLAQIKVVAMSAVTKGWTAAQFALNAVMSANPIALLVIAIGTLIAAGVAVWQNWDTIKVKLDQLWAKFRFVFNNIKSHVKSILDQVVGFFRDNWAAILAILFPPVGLAALVWLHWNRITDSVRAVWDNVKNVFRFGINALIHFLNAFIRGWNNLELSIPSFDIPFVGTFGGYSIGLPFIPEIPQLAMGGIVTEPTLALIGESGPEAVVPLGRGGIGGSITIMGDVYGYDDFVDKVGQAQITLQRTGG